MKNILVIGAHFDDTDLGVGGSCAKWSSEGKKVYKLTLTDNVTNFSQKGIHVDFVSSKDASKKASKVLGCIEVDFNPVHCNELKYSSELMQKIEKIIYDLNIDTVILHFNGDVNQDHVEASRLCLTAARHCQNVLMYLSNGYVGFEIFKPCYFVDISNEIEKKKKALSMYSPEHNRFNRLFEINIERNHIYGYANKCEYAEGFVVIRMKEE